MKTFRHTLCAAAVALCLGSSMHAQKIQYFYFAPEADMQQAFGDTAKEFRRKDDNGDLYTELPGYRFVVIKADNYDTFRAIAAPNMLRTYDRLTTDTQLKKEVERLMSLSGRIVDVNISLVDDRIGLSTSLLFCAYPDTSDNKMMAWPCARNRKKKEGPRYLGQVFLGERAASKEISMPGGFLNWEGTIIHEFSHTQFLPDPEYGRNKWNSVGISYGGDQGHWFKELMADEQMALDEGMGSFFGLAHNPAAANKLVNFLNLKGPRFLLGSRSFLTGVPDMWDSPHHLRYSGSVNNLPGWITLVNTPMEGNFELREYKWLDVPSKYVMYNEQMAQAYFYLIYKYAFADPNKAYRRIFLAAQEMAKPNVHNRYPAFAANHIAKNMELYAGSRLGKDDATNGRLVSSMFAYGVYDVLTHFDLSEEDFKRVLRANQSGSSLPLAYVKYWGQREKLRQLVCPDLGGNDCQVGNGKIDILKATEVMRDFFLNPSLILEETI